MFFLFKRAVLFLEGLFLLWSLGCVCVCLFKRIVLFLEGLFIMVSRLLKSCTRI